MMRPTAACAYACVRTRACTCECACACFLSGEGDEGGERERGVKTCHSWCACLRHTWCVCVCARACVSARDSVFELSEGVCVVSFTACTLLLIRNRERERITHLCV